MEFLAALIDTLADLAGLSLTYFWLLLGGCLILAGFGVVCFGIKLDSLPLLFGGFAVALLGGFCIWIWLGEDHG